MLASMVEINNFKGPRKVFSDQIPYPFRAVTDDHLLFRPAPTSVERFPIDALAKLYRGFDGSGIGGGIWIADGEAFLVPGGLPEHTA